MPLIEKIQSNDPHVHARNIVKYLHELKDHCREDLAAVDDPKAQSLFETAADVLGGLEKAFRDYEKFSELEGADL
jgi:hypothetical protein